MGYLNKETVTVDAILTKKGRELLSEGRNLFDIRKFAVADDEIDYGLYDPAHPLGSEFYGKIIEEMPIVEASPDETQNLRYKLVTLDRNAQPGGVNVLPIISTGLTSITLTAGRNEQSPTITPQTSQGPNITLDGETFGYTAVLLNGNAANIIVTPVEGGPAVSPFVPGVLTASAKVAIGRTFVLTPRNTDTQINTQLIITGNQSGATITIPVTIFPNPSNL
jgi:hypothetical protein